MTAKHGTTIFFIKDPCSGAQLVSCRELEADHRSLDLTSWQPVLQDYGWNLIRPPRIRVFYADDVLYTDAEIPATMMAMTGDNYQNTLIDYNRAIASLVFPHTNISELPVNTHSHSAVLPEQDAHCQVFSTSPYQTTGSQALAALDTHFDEILASYNLHQGSNLTPIDFSGLDKRIAVMQMLRVDNIGFLHEIMPRLLNRDFSTVKDEKLLLIRDMHLLDYEKNLPTIEKVDQIEIECNVLLKKESVIASLKQISSEQFNILLTAFNKANRCDYDILQFPPESRYVAIMEMLNRDGQNIAFLRRTLRWFLDIDLLIQNDEAIFALRDRITHNYMDFIDRRYLSDKVEQLVENVDHLLKEELKPDTSFAEKFLKLAIHVANSVVQAVAAELGLPIIAKEEDRQALSRQLLANLYAKILENDLGPVHSSDLLPQTQQLLDSNPLQLSAIIHKIADEFTHNKILHQRGALSFFFGHNATTDAFVNSLHTLVAEEISPEQLKFKLIDTLQRFHDALVDNNEKKILVILSNVLNTEFPTADMPSPDNSWDVVEVA